MDNDPAPTNLSLERNLGWLEWVVGREVNAADVRIQVIWVMRRKQHANDFGSYDFRPALSQKARIPHEENAA